MPALVRLRPVAVLVAVGLAVPLLGPGTGSPAAAAPLAHVPGLPRAAAGLPRADAERLTAVVAPGLLLVTVPVVRGFREGRRDDPADPLQVEVRDTRPGSVGWSLGGIASSFRTSDGAARSTSVRWQVRLVASSPGMTITVSPIGAGTAIPGDPGAASRLLATSPAGGPVGTATFAVTPRVPHDPDDARFGGEITFTVL